VKTQHYFQV